jgi:hypothetical protein
MVSREILTIRQTLKATTAFMALTLLASCATTKEPAPDVDQGAIGDTDAPQVIYRDKGAYRDPMVSTGRKGSNAAPAKAPTAQLSYTQEVETADAAAPNAAAAQTSLFAAHPQAPTDAESVNSIVPSGLPTRSIQATVTSVYSLQKPLEQQAQVEPVEPAPAAPVVHQQRPPTKAEILAGLAPDPSKRQHMQQMRRPGMANQMNPGQIIPGQINPAMVSQMASQLSPGEAARLQASIPTATPAAANSSAATQMEQIEGAPQAQGMTRDSFIKKFLAKLRK